ncbi:hypothetical protein [Streptococcus sanguinis]|uniref:Uncharacterized protein n=1 Tax=Streptococcus sanguinis TaxID=1305 RepID=A0A427ZBR6_STRSA|nr:hypothetical protein [Streptococcus sanguinis]RSI11586.1 hypothetical protein D8887_02640 [Streptococcus sanguinis]
MTDLPVSGNRMYRPVALLATGFFMESKTEINFVSISAQQKLKNAG